MTQRLANKMTEVILKEGVGGRARLSLAAEKSDQMIDRYRKGLSKPPAKVAYKLALACGFTEEEALDEAKELSSDAARETA